MHSVESLHSQKGLYHSQSTSSFANMPFKENFNHQSALNIVSNNAKSTIPRVNFQKSTQVGSFVPVFIHKSNSTTVSVKPTHPILFKQSTEHVKCVSILCPPLSEAPVPKNVE